MIGYLDTLGSSSTSHKISRSGSSSGKTAVLWSTKPLVAAVVAQCRAVRMGADMVLGDAATSKLSPR
jgi:hypothetical protein